MPRSPITTMSDEQLRQYIDTVAPVMKWEQFLSEFSESGGDFIWRQGEHVTLIGNTSSGKTTLARAILPIRQYVTAFGTKPKSESLQRFLKDGYERIAVWPDKGDPRRFPRRMLWPRIATRFDRQKLRAILDHALDRIFYYEEGWCVYFDELPELVENLGLGEWIKLFLRQGRELHISVVTAMQRPKFVPLDVYTNSTHIFMFQEKDGSNLERLSAISAVDSLLVYHIITELELHQFLYINTRTGQMARCMTPKPS